MHVSVLFVVAASQLIPCMLGRIAVSSRALQQANMVIINSSVADYHVPLGMVSVLFFSSRFHSHESLMATINQLCRFLRSLRFSVQKSGVQHLECTDCAKLFRRPSLRFVPEWISTRWKAICYQISSFEVSSYPLDTLALKTPPQHMYSYFSDVQFISCQNSM